MNLRIQELAEQADEYAEQTVHYYMGQFDGLTWEGKIKQTRDIKFAELIVRECVREVGYKSVELLDIDFYPHYQERLKKHFGVE